MNVRKMVVSFDYILFLVTILLTIIGVLFIYSANLNKPAYLKTEYLKQILFAIVSLSILIGLLFMETRNVRGMTEILYVICIIGLFLTLFFPSVKGQRRFSILGFSLQFSEFLKIATVMFLAKFYSQNQAAIKSLVVYLKGALIVFIPVGVVLLQPDLGSALVFIPLLVVVSFIAGVKKRYLLYTLMFFFAVTFIPVVTTINSLFYKNENEVIYLMTNYKYVAIVFAFLIITLAISLLAYFNVIKGVSDNFKSVFYWYIFFASVLTVGLFFSYPVNKYVLKDYQKDRLLIFFNPYVDPLGKGYNIIQAKTAIGNGGFFGKGWQKGDMIQNMFLPEQSTDFIYPVIAEEFGFIGSLLLLFLYSLYFYRGVSIAMYSKDLWSMYVASGLLSITVFHILENMGMCIGIMPITGIPLPFISYGGSFLIACYLSTGILMNFHINRYQY